MSSPIARWLAGAGLAVLGTYCLAQTTQPATCPPPITAPTEAQLDEIQKTARDRGPLWRISKDGRQSYLYGTLHVGKPEWLIPGPALTHALKNTEVLALELDVTDPDIQRVLTAPLPPERTLRVSDALRRRLDAQAAQACIPADALAGMHPALQVMTYTLLAARWEGFEGAYGQEFLLASFAKATERPLISLETAESQRDALIPKDPAEALRAIEDGLELLEGNKVRQPLKRLAEVWALGDLAELAKYEQWCDCIKDEHDRATMKRLNDGRNPHLADGIAALHGQGKPVLAAVGSLHMTGAQALPRLLAERGFTVERVDAHKPDGR